MKFKDEYVLARGWPFFPYGEQTVGMVKREDANIDLGGGDARLRYPRILNGRDCPKYELVLRKVKS